MRPLNTEGSRGMRPLIQRPLNTEGSRGFLQVDKGEFLIGLRGVGVDLPPKLMNKLWGMADEDGSGAIHYQEFARKFSTYKATASTPS